MERDVRFAIRSDLLKSLKQTYNVTPILPFLWRLCVCFVFSIYASILSASEENINAFCEELSGCIFSVTLNKMFIVLVTLMRIIVEKFVHGMYMGVSE